MISPNDAQDSSRAVRARMRDGFTFQISVDVGVLALGLTVAEAALKAGITIVEMGTPLLKTEGVKNVVPAFRSRFPDALLLADMKTMDGGGYEARGVYEGGGNVIDFLALAGAATARGVCAVRDEYRGRDPSVPRLAFADILLPHQGAEAIDVARQMLDAGVDGIGIHLQFDARRADPAIHQSAYLSDIAAAVFEAVGREASVQAVGGLTVAQAQALARRGLRAFVISGNFGLEDPSPRYGDAPDELERLIAAFIAGVSTAA